MRRSIILTGALLTALLHGCHAGADRAELAQGSQQVTTDGKNVAGRRAIDLSIQRWWGAAISYSGYREGQSPDSGVSPSREEIAEDLKIIARNWKLIRVYGSGPYARDILEVIRTDKIDLKVMLGAWLAKEPGSEKLNADQVEECIHLTNAYPDVVVAVNVGNEILIDWTEHPVPEERVIEYVRHMKAAVSVPVTVADNYVWWRDHGRALAKEVDFVTFARPLGAWR